MKQVCPLELHMPNNALRPGQIGLDEGGFASSLPGDGRNHLYLYLHRCLLHSFDDLHDVQIDVLFSAQTKTGP